MVTLDSLSFRNDTSAYVMRLGIQYAKVMAIQLCKSNGARRTSGEIDTAGARFGDSDLYLEIHAGL